MPKQFAKIAETSILGQTANAISIGLVTVAPYHAAYLDYTILNRPQGLEADFQATIICTGRLTISGEDYDLWGSSDDYLYSQLCSKLGLTILPD